MEAGVMKLVTGCDPQRVVADVASLERARAFQDQFTGDRRLHELSRRNAFDLGMMRALARIMRQRQVDVVHTHAWGTLVEGRLAARLAGVKHFIHGEHGTMQLKPLNVRLQRVLWRRADRLLTVSNELAERLVARVGVSRDLITVVPNGVDTTRFGTVTREAARAALSLPADAFVVVCIGRLVPVKNYPLLLDAASALKAAGVAAQFLIAGDGPLRSDFERRIAADRLTDSVRLLGVRNDTPVLLAAADAFALTSHSEGMSNTILEAMAAGRPVVATRVGGNPELVQDGLTGMLVSPDGRAELVAALRSLLADRAAAEAMGRRGRERVEREFSLAGMINRYTAIYETVTGRGEDGAVLDRISADKSLLIS